MQAKPPRSEEAAPAAPAPRGSAKKIHRHAGRADLSDLPDAGPHIMGWETFFEGCPVPGWVCLTDDHRIVAMNGAAEDLLKTDRRNWIGRCWEEFQEGGGVPGEDSGSEVRLKTGEGTWADLKISAQHLAWEGKAARHFCGVDVSEKRELEARLLRNQRLECIGMLASGVAHDLNNVLSPMMMAASMLNGELPLDQKQEFVKTIEESAQQGVALLRQVLAFVKGIEGEFQPLRPENVLDEVMRMVRRTFPKLIEVRYVMPIDPLGEIMGDATKLQQVILNLAVNARDVMERGGILEVRAENVTLTEADTAVRKGLAAGAYVKIIVRDTGPGIADDIQRQIFQPFFTTKAPEKGSGLGLTTVLGIVKRHRGWVEVESRLGEGATFVLLLPVSKAPAESPENDAKEPSGETPRETIREAVQGGTVLVVDDEPGICRLVEAILTRQGFEVVIAATGAEALEKYREQKGNIHAVLADLMMPGMDGVMLVGALKRVDPAVEIVVTSGAELDSRTEELQRMGVVGFLKKPYRALELVDAVAGALLRHQGRMEA